MNTIPANQLVPADSLPPEIAVILPLLGVKDYHIRWGQNGLEITVDLELPDAELKLDFGGENGFSAIFEELVHLELTLADMLELRVELERMYLRLPTLFRPATLINNQWTIHQNDRVEVPFNGVLRIDHDMNILPGFDPITIEPFTIENTDIFLSLTNCKIILSKLDITAELLALDQTPEFIGIYSTEAVFQWLPELHIAGFDVPGLRLTFQNIALGNSGVSFELQQDFIVEHNETEFLPSTELKGALFNEDWAVALSSVGISLRNNIPNNFSLRGVIHIALLNSFFDVEFGINRSVSGFYSPSLSIYKSTATPITIDLGVGEISLTQLGISGLIQEGGFALDGLFGGTLNLAPISVSIEQAQFSLSHTPEEDAFSFELTNVHIGPLGQVELAKLEVISEKFSDSDDRQLTIQLETKMAWQDLHARLNLNNVPDKFPLPPDDAEISVYVFWQQDGKFTLRFATAIPEPDSLWPFIPEEFRPDTRNLVFTFEANYEDVDTLNSTSSSAQFEGEVAIELEMLFPELGDLPGSDIFVYENDWLKARLETGIRTAESGSNEVFMALNVTDPLAFGIQFPGMPQAQPPIQVDITTIDFDVQASGDNTAGHFKIVGGFQLHPINPAESGLPVPPFMATQIEMLFQHVNFSDINGKATFDLQFKNNKAAMGLICEFTDAAIELDLFDMLMGLTRGLPSPQGIAEDTNTIDLDIEIGIQLSKIALQLGSVEESSSDQNQFSFELLLDFSFAGFMAENFSFKLSDQEFSFGFEKLEIPIALPHFPISRNDLDQLRDSSNAWDYPGKWITETEPDLTNAITTLKSEVMALKNQLETSQGEDRAVQDLLRQKRKILFEKTGKKFLIESIFAVHQFVGDGNRGNYQQLVEWYMSLMDATLHQFSFDTQLYFVLRDVRFVLPFQNPSDIRVEGGAQISGFHPEDPMTPLGDMIFKLGLSAEAIYFAVEGGDPIPLPLLGSYIDAAGEEKPKVSVALNHARFGYGYSKNALHIDIAGAINIAPEIADTLDTSDLIGAGIRLPEQSRLAFKLDLIPITLGEVDFLLPLFEFDIDLRKDFSPGLVSSEKCEPFSDGLQFIVPNIIREDFKRMHFAPFWGPLPAPNYVFSFDLMLGNNDYGLTHICDDYKVVSPILTSSAAIPIPLLADNVPFFDNFCVNVRLAGFAVNFNLQRPYPSLSPLVFFEIFGLIADPMMPVNPEGQLANTIRVSLKNASIKLPPAVVSMFPENGTLLERKINYTINLGTLITISQAIGGQIGEMIKTVQNASENFGNLIEDFKNNPPDLSPESILAQLPPELRSFQANGSFIGFDASATFVLLSPQNAQTEFVKRSQSSEQIDNKILLDETFSSTRMPDWNVVNDASTRSKWLIQNKTWQQVALTRGATFQIYKQIFSDGLFTTVLQSISGQEIGVVFGWQDVKNHYRFSLYPKSKVGYLLKVKNGRATSLIKKQINLTNGKAYEISVQFSSEKTTTQTSISVKIDKKSWGQITDKKQALTKGQIGIYCRNNNSAYFKSIHVEQLNVIHPPQKGEPTDPQWMSRFQPNFTKETTPVFNPHNPATNVLNSEIFSDFEATIFNEIPQPSAVGVLVGAQIKVLENQKFNFLGFIFTDGSFALLSSLNLEPLLFTVTGIPIELPLTLKGRLALSGRSAGANSHAQIAAQTSGSWDAIPGIVRLKIATSNKPASLIIRSNFKFAVQGAVELNLFNGSAKVNGQIDLSDTHCFVNGNFEFKPDHFIAGKRSVEIALSTQGRIGPGAHFELGGNGTLKILGQTISAVKGILSDRGVAVEGTFSTADWSWNGIKLNKYSLTLRGLIELDSGSFPNFLLEGDASLSLFNKTARIDGKGGIKAHNGELSNYISGQLFWQNRKWLEGRIEVGTEKVSVEGRTLFAVSLLNLPANLKTQFASLFFSIEIGGKFELSKSGVLSSCDLETNWTMSVKLPGGGEQVIPIASQALDIHFSLPSTSSNLKTIHELVSVDKISLLPVNDIQIPVPTLKPKSSGRRRLYLTMQSKSLSTSISAPKVITSNISNADYKFPTGYSASTKKINLIYKIRSAVNTLKNKLSVIPFPNLPYPPSGTKVEISVPEFKVTSEIGIDKNASYPINLPSFSLPSLSTSSGSTKLLDVPTNFEVEFKNRNLGTLLDKLNFTVSLGWKGTDLGLIVKQGSKTTFTPFKEMFK